MTDKTARYYQLLDLKPGASPDQVRRAYVDLTRVWHPDRFASDPRLQRVAEEKLKDINQAFRALRLMLGEAGAKAAPPDPSGKPIFRILRSRVILACVGRAGGAGTPAWMGT
jgi:hypothetical protein